MNFETVFRSRVGSAAVRVRHRNPTRDIVPPAGPQLVRSARGLDFRTGTAALPGSPPRGAARGASVALGMGALGGDFCLAGTERASRRVWAAENDGGLDDGGATC